MGPSIKHVLGVLERSYVVPEFFSSKWEFGFGCPPHGLANDQTFYYFCLGNLPLTVKIISNHIIFIKIASNQSHLQVQLQNFHTSKTKQSCLDRWAEKLKWQSHAR